MCFLFLFALLSSFTIGTTAEAITGAGTEDDPYRICTAADLRAVTADLTGYYVQMNDIDLEHEDFPAIAKNDNPGFQGTYDGQGYKIKNLKVLMDSFPTGAGLFAKCNNATIKNIKLVNPEIENTTGSSGPNMGGIAGVAVNTSISNCSVTGEGYIKNSTLAGGIVGEITNSTILECDASVPVINNFTSGGIVGSSRGTSTIEKCYATNTVTSRAASNTFVGGIVGSFPGNNLTITKCFQQET